jgi:hypothetical protein
MLFNKSIVAFVAAITLATSVAAAATPPVTGTGQNTGSPNQGSNQDNNQGSVQGSIQGSNQGSSQAPTCSPGLNPMCCDAVTPFTTLSDDVRTQLKGLDPSLDQNGNVGQKCAPPVGSQGWYCVLCYSHSMKWLTCHSSGTQKPLCCDSVQSAGQCLYSFSVVAIVGAC